MDGKLIEVFAVAVSFFKVVALLVAVFVAVTALFVAVVVFANVAALLAEVFVSTEVSVTLIEAGDCA